MDFPFQLYGSNEYINGIEAKITYSIPKFSINGNNICIPEFEYVNSQYQIKSNPYIDFKITDYNFGDDNNLKQVIFNLINKYPSPITDMDLLYEQSTNTVEVNYFNNDSYLILKEISSNNYGKYTDFYSDISLSDENIFYTLCNLTNSYNINFDITNLVKSKLKNKDKEICFRIFRANINTITSGSNTEYSLNVQVNQKLILNYGLLSHYKSSKKHFFNPIYGCITIDDYNNTTNIIDKYETEPFSIYTRLPQLHSYVEIPICDLNSHNLNTSLKYIVNNTKLLSSFNLYIEEFTSKIQTEDSFGNIKTYIGYNDDFLEKKYNLNLKNINSYTNLGDLSYIYKSGSDYILCLNQSIFYKYFNVEENLYAVKEIYYGDVLVYSISWFKNYVVNIKNMTLNDCNDVLNVDYNSTNLSELKIKLNNSTISMTMLFDDSFLLNKILIERDEILGIQDKSIINEVTFDYENDILTIIYDNNTKRGTYIKKENNLVELTTYTLNNLENCYNKVSYFKSDNNVKITYPNNSTKTIYFDKCGTSFLRLISDEENYDDNVFNEYNHSYYELNNNYIFLKEKQLIKSFNKSNKTDNLISCPRFDESLGNWKTDYEGFTTDLIIQDDYLSNILGDKAIVINHPNGGISQQIRDIFKKGEIYRLEFWIKRDEQYAKGIEDFEFKVYLGNSEESLLFQRFVITNNEYNAFVFYLENTVDCRKLDFSIEYLTNFGKFYIKNVKLHRVGTKNLAGLCELSRINKFDSNNRLYFSKDGLNIVEYNYNDKNLISRIKNHFSGEEVLFEYDNLNNIINQTQINNLNESSTTKYEYYPNGLLKKIIDNNNLETLYNYDYNNNVIDIVYNDGSSYKYEYNDINEISLIKSLLNDNPSITNYSYCNNILSTMKIDDREIYSYLYNDFLLNSGYKYRILDKEYLMENVQYVNETHKKIDSLTNYRTPKTSIVDDIEEYSCTTIDYDYKNDRLNKILLNNDYSIRYEYFQNKYNTLKRLFYTFIDKSNIKSFDVDEVENTEKISHTYSEDEDYLITTIYNKRYNNKNIYCSDGNLNQMYLYNNLYESSIMYEIEKYNSVNINDYMIGSMPQPLFYDYSTSYNVLSEFDPILHSNVLLLNNKKHYSEINLSKINNYRIEEKLYGNVNYYSDLNKVKNKLDIIMLFKPCGDNVELFTLETNNEINFRLKINNGLNIELFDENNSYGSEKITNIELNKWHLLRLVINYNNGNFYLLVNLDGIEIVNNLNYVTEEQTNNIVFNKIILGNYNHEEDLTHSNLNIGYFSINSNIDYSNTDSTSTDNFIKRVIDYLNNPNYVSNVDIITYKKNYDIIDFNSNLVSVDGMKPNIIEYTDNYAESCINGIFEYDYELKKNVLNMTKNKLYNNQTSQNIICYQLSSNNLKNLKIKFKCTKCGSNNSLLYYEKNDFELYLYLDECNNLNLLYETKEEGVIGLNLCNITLNTWHEFSYRFNNGVLYYCLDGVGYSQNIIEPYLEDGADLYVGNDIVNNYFNGYIEYIKFSNDSEVDLDDDEIIYYQKNYSNQNFVSSESIKYGNKTLTKTYEKLQSNFKNNVPNVEVNFDNTKTHYHYNKDGILIGLIVYDNSDNMIIKKHYFYDSYNQIIKEECYNSVDSNNNYIICFEYDLKGNIVKKQEYSIEDDLICEYIYVYDTYIPNNLLSVVKRLPDGTETTEYSISYFENFIKAIQTINKNGVNYKIQYLNNWITSIGNNKYYYDDQGLRIKKITENNEEFTYYYEDNRLVHMTFNINDILEHSITYLYNDTNQLIGLYFNDKPYFYSRDLTGNINSIIDINGKVMVKYYYDAYGKPTIQCLDEEDGDYSVSYALSKCNVFMYKGYIYDVETNLALVSSRYYSPELGRFIQPADVSSLNQQSINGLNLYTYALNNPISITHSTFSVGRSASSGIGSFPIGKYSNSTMESSNSNSSGPTFGNIFTKAKSTYDDISDWYGVYVSGSTILDNMYFIKNIKPFADDMKMLGVPFRKGVLSFNDFNWKMGKGDFIALGIDVFADMYDSYQRGVSTEGIILGGALTAATGVGMIYLNKGIMYGATAIGSCFGPAGTVVGFVVGGVVCIVTDLFLLEWLGIDEWIDSVAK